MSATSFTDGITPLALFPPSTLYHSYIYLNSPPRTFYTPLVPECLCALRNAVALRKHFGPD